MTVHVSRPRGVPPTHCTSCGGLYATRADAERLRFGHPDEPGALCWRLVSWRATCEPDPDGALLWGQAQRRRALRARAAFAEVVEAGGAQPDAVERHLQQLREQLAEARAVVVSMAATLGLPSTAPPALVLEAFDRRTLTARQRIALQALERATAPLDARAALDLMRRIDRRAAPASPRAAARTLHALERSGLVSARRRPGRRTTYERRTP